MLFRNVYLIDLGTGTDRSLMPLSCGLLLSYAHSCPELKDIHFKILMLDKTIDDLVDEIESPWVVGLSCYCWNALGCVETSQKIKERFPECVIVWGGSQVPLRHRRAIQFMEDNECVDIIVRGEGELTFADLLIRLKHGMPLTECEGIAFRENGTITNTPQRERIKNLSSLPSPFLTGVFDDVLERYRESISGVLWETNRGCPFSCSFCDWGQALVNKVHFFDPDRVIKEIEWVSNQKIGYVYATDANFGIKTDRDLGIATRFGDISQKTGYPNTLVLNWTKNSHKGVVKIADTLLHANVTTNVTLSYQTLHQLTSAAIQRSNIKLDHLQHLKTEYHQRGIPTYSELILGLPEETFDSFLDGLEKSIGLHVCDQIMIYLCCVLENTQLREDKEKYGLQTRRCAVGLNRRKMKYPRFGEDEIVVATNAMSIEDWESLYDISFMFMSLYNLRVAYFIMVFLNAYFGVRFTDFIRFVLDSTDHDIVRECVEHLKKNRDLIRSNTASVSAPRGSEGVVFTPHEAITFLFLSNLDETYDEMKQIVSDFCGSRGLDLSPVIIDDLIEYQKLRIPTFDQSYCSNKFVTNLPIFIDKTTRGERIPLSLKSTEVSFSSPSHNYDNEVEFNRRRVSCGYSIRLNDVETL